MNELAFFCCICQDMLPSRMEKPVGKVTVPCNPASLEAVTVEPLSVPSESFFVNGTTAATNSYYLRFCVRRLSSGNVRQTRGRDSSSDLGMVSLSVVILCLCNHYLACHCIFVCLFVIVSVCLSKEHHIIACRAVMLSPAVLTHLIFSSICIGSQLINALNSNLLPWHIT